MATAPLVFGPSPSVTTLVPFTVCSQVPKQYDGAEGGGELLCSQGAGLSQFRAELAQPLRVALPGPVIACGLSLAEVTLLGLGQFLRMERVSFESYRPPPHTPIDVESGMRVAGLKQGYQSGTPPHPV